MKKYFKNKLKFESNILLFLFLFFLLINLVLSISNYDEDFFVLNVDSSNVINSGWINYTINSDYNLNYDVELYYDDKNILVGNDNFYCGGLCNRGFKLNNIFFGNYTLYIHTFKDDELYEVKKKIEVSIPKRNFDVYLNSKQVYGGGIMNIKGKLVSNYSSSKKFIFKIENRFNPDYKYEFDLDCLKECDFSFPLKKGFLFGDYYLRVYSFDNFLQKEFKIVDDFKEDKKKKISSSKGDNNLNGYDRNNINTNINKFDSVDENVDIKDSYEYEKNKDEFEWDFFLKGSEEISLDKKKKLLDDWKKEKEDLKKSKYIEVQLDDEIQVGDEFELPIELKGDKINKNDIIIKSNFEVIGKEESNSIFSLFGFSEDKVNYKLRANSLDGFINIYDKKTGILLKSLNITSSKSKELSNLEKKFGVNIKRINLSDNVGGFNELELRKGNIELEFENIREENIKLINVIPRDDVKNNVELNNKNINFISDILYVEASNFTSAKVVLNKYEKYVKNIYVCNNISNNQCLGEWNKINVSFRQNSTNVWFNVSHFSAYAADGGTYNFTIEFVDLTDRVFKQNSLNNLTFNITCKGGDCGSINITLLYLKENVEMVDSFESGSLNTSFWNFLNSNSYSRTQVTTQSQEGGVDPYDGSYLVSFDSNSDGDYENSVLKSVFDFSDFRLRIVDFFWTDSGDETDNCGDHSGDFCDGEGFFYTCNGNDWFEVVPFDPASIGTGSWQNVNSDISTDSDYCDPINSSFAIKFTQYDNYEADTDGIYFDLIKLIGDRGEKIINNSGSKPFYILGEDLKQVSLVQDETQLLNFTINSSGDYDIYRLYLVAVSSTDSSIRSQSSDLNVGIADGQNPNGTKISPINNYNTSGSAYVLFNVSLQDDTNLSSAEIFVWNSLNKLVYKIKNSVSGLSNNSIWNLSFSTSDIYSWDVLVKDQGGNYDWVAGGKYNINVTVPEVSVVWLDPVQDTFKQKDNFFDMKVRIDCKNYDCGDLNVSLIHSKGINITETFLTETLDDFWNFLNSNSYSSTRITYASRGGGLTPYDGDYMVSFDSNTNGNYETSVLKSVFNFDFITAPIFDYYIADTSDESTQCGDHSGDFCDGDGFFYTCNGTDWFEVDYFDPENLNNAQWYSRSFDLSSDSNICGDLNSSFAVKYTQYDNYGGDTDGMYFDYIRIHSNNEYVPSSGTPFYTDTLNPSTIVDMNSGDSIEFTFRVNASGDIDDVKRFAVLVEGLNNTFISTLTEPLSITIKTETEVSTCQDLGGNTLYKLTADILDYGADCFKFNGDNIVFNGYGHIVDGDDGNSNDDAFSYKNSGDHYSNIEIKNLKLTDWGRGVDLYANSDISIINVSIKSGLSYGIRCRNDSVDCSNLRLNNIIIDGIDSSDGIFIQNGKGIVIRDVNISRVGDSSSTDTGITFDTGEYRSIVLDNVNINSIEGHGIYFESVGSNVNISNVYINTTLNSGGIGIYFHDNTSNISLNSINILNSGDDGIEFVGLSQNINFNDIRILNSTDAGLRFDNFDGAVLNNVFIDGTTNNEGILTENSLINSYLIGVTIKNIGTDGSDEGIYAINTKNTLFKNIVLNNIYGEGIYLGLNSKNNYFENINIDYVGDDGIEFNTNVSDNILTNINLINIGFGTASDGIHTSGNCNNNSYYGIYIENVSDEGIEFYETNNLTILDGIKIINVTGEGLYFNDNGDLTSNDLILKNILINLTKVEGLLFQNSKNVFVNNLTILNVGDEAGEDSIVITSGVNQEYHNITIKNSFDSFIHSTTQSSNILFDDLYLLNSGGYGFELYDGAVNFELNNVYIDNVKDYGIAFDAGTSTNNNNVYLNNITIFNVGTDDGIYLEQANNSRLLNIYEDNIGDGSGDYVIYVSDSLNITISNFTGLRLNDGIRLSDNSINSNLFNISLNNSSGIMVYFGPNSGNFVLNQTKFENSGSDAIYIDSSSIGSILNIYMINITNNLIYVLNSSYLVINNISSNLTTSTSSYGLYIDSNSNNIYVNNFTMLNLGDYGIYYNSLNNFFKNLLIDSPNNYAIRSNINDINTSFFNIEIISAGNVAMLFDDNSSDLILKNISIKSSAGSRSIIIDTFSNNCNVNNISIQESTGGEGFKTYCNNSRYSNILINNSNTKGFYIQDVWNSLFENISIYNSDEDGLYLYSVLNSNFNNISVSTSLDEQFEFYYVSNNNFSYCSILDNATSGNWNLYYDSNSLNNNYIFNKFLTSSKISSGDWSIPVYWNITTVNGSIGNYWEDLICINSRLMSYAGELYQICNDPYDIYGAEGVYDFAPILDSINTSIGINFVDPTPLNNSVVSGDVLINTSEVGILEHSSFINFGLISYWNFDEVSGTNVKDYIGTSDASLINGALVNNLTYKRGDYVQLDGVDDYVDSNEDLSWNRSESFSISVLFRSNVIDSTKYPILGKENQEYSLMLNSNNISFIIWDSSGNEALHLESNKTLVSDRWYFVTIVYDAVENKGRIFLNGEEVTNEIINDITLDFANLNENIRIGRAYVGSDVYFNGYIDEVYIYNRTLSMNEIKSLYNSNNNNYESLINLKDIYSVDSSYEIFVCNINQIANISCTENRTYILNGEVLVNVSKPIKDSYFIQNSSVYIEINSTADLDFVRFYLNDDNLTIYNMSENSPRNWSYVLYNLSPDFYNITVEYNDTNGIWNSTFWSGFRYFKNSSQQIRKEIFSIGENVYNVSLNISNYWFNQKLRAYDFVPEGMIHYSYSINYDDNYSFSGVKYSGEYLIWNLSMFNGGEVNIWYLINTSGDYSSTKMNIFGIE